MTKVVTSGLIDHNNVVRERPVEGLLTTGKNQHAVAIDAIFFEIIKRPCCATATPRADNDDILRCAPDLTENRIEFAKVCI